MHLRTKHHVLYLLFFLTLSVTGCSKTVPPQQALPEAAADPAPAPEKSPEACPPGTMRPPAVALAEPQPDCLECEAVTPNANRGGCFKLQPGTTSKNKKGKTVIGRCQPQCIPYARCRSGIKTCQLGDTGPVEWFQCARKNKATTNTPKAGSIMVIDVNKQRKMPTGHLGFVEEACPNGDGTWTLRFSHTNYDRKCHLDLDAKVLFNPKTMEASFLSGPWKTWAKDLKICGFILR